MFPRLKGLMTLFAILCVAAIAGGSAYFYFGGKVSDERSISNETEGTDNTGGVTADNILENYEFGNDKDLNETYTYYFFPSTLYMTNDFFDPDTMPETVFGYNEVILDDNGDPVLDSNNQPQYKIVQDNITGISRNGETYDTYFSYLKKYLNSDTTTYLNSSSIQPNYSFSNKGKSSEQNSVDGNVYTYGISVSGDDSHVQGYSTSMKDPYILNNTKLSSELLLNNVKSINYKKGSKEGYNNFYHLNGDFNTTIEYADEVLSPIYYEENSENKTYDISLGLNDEKIELINAYADYYQHGSNSRLNSNSLTVTSDNGQIHYKGSWPNRVYIQGTFRDHSPFYNNTSDHELQCFSLEEIEKSPRLGTWFGTNSDRSTIVFTFLKNGRGYFYDFAGYEIVGFDYSDSDNSDGSKKISFETDTSPSYPFGFSGTLQLNTSDPTSQMVNRAQYRNDRFGFWTAFYDWDDPTNLGSYIQNSASRYLPIKITVNGNLTPDDMSKVIPTLSASMFDNNMWADFSANVWTYVPYDSENKQYDFDSEDSKEYTTGTGGFTAKDINNIFDIMQNPSKYADKDGNIRLFPVFSNGKNAGSDKKENGGSDAIQASFEYNSLFEPTINNDINPSSTKMTYSSVDYKYYAYDVNYAVLKNVAITKDKFTSFKIRIDTTDTVTHWSGNWTDIYSFNPDQLNKLISVYGEGLYTFYLFVGGRATNENRGDTPFNGQDLVSKVTADSSPGNELYKKYILPLSDSFGTDIVVDGASSNKYVYNTKDDINEQARPVALAVEKVTNLRLVSDIPIAEDESGEPKNDQNWAEIDNSIKQGLLNAKNFTIADEVYGFDANIYEMDNIDLTLGTRLDTNNPYIYVIQNADFRFVNNLYFQIRFSNDYIANSMNVVTDYKYAPEGTQKYIAYSIQGQVIKFKFQDSQNDNDVFIDNTNPISGDLNGQTVERQGFKLKDYNARGIFDILLISTGTEGGKQFYNMYVNRHKNSFIKLFDGNPGTFEYQAEGTNQATNNFVSHKLPSEVSPEEKQDSIKDPTRDENSSLIWNGQTYLGEYLTSKTVGTRYSRNGTNEETPITDPNNDNSLFAAIQACCGVTPGVDTIYAIKDAVTGQVVAYYNSGVGRLFTSSGSVGDTSDSLDLFTIVKNYVLYIEEVKFNITT